MREAKYIQILVDKKSLGIFKLSTITNWSTVVDYALQKGATLEIREVTHGIKKLMKKHLFTEPQ